MAHKLVPHETKCNEESEQNINDNIKCRNIFLPTMLNTWIYKMKTEKIKQIFIVIVYIFLIIQ